MRLTLTDLMKISEHRGSEGPLVREALAAAYKSEADRLGMPLAQFRQEFTATGRLVGNDSGAELEITFKKR